MPRFLRSRGPKLITPRALVIRASISVTNRCASDPHANSLLIRSSGSCRMFGHPRVSRSHCHANGKSPRPVPYTREGIFHVGCGTYAGVLCLPTWHACRALLIPCVATRWVVPRIFPTRVRCGRRGRPKSLGRKFTSRSQPLCHRERQGSDPVPSVQGRVMVAKPTGNE